MISAAATNRKSEASPAVDLPPPSSLASVLARASALLINSAVVGNNAALVTPNPLINERRLMPSLIIWLPGKMESPVAPIGLAIVAFVSTNIDDLFVLVTFLVDRHFTVRDVVIGQYAGMAALYAISGIAAMISLIIPPAYLGLLGLVPLAIGIKKLWYLLERDEKKNAQSVSNARANRVLAVASVTIANGGDNIAVYAALFASHGISDGLTIGIAFAVMTGLWCLAAHWLVNHRHLQGPIRRQAHRIAPFVLIGLGTLILIRTGALSFWRSPRL